MEGDETLLSPARHRLMFSHMYYFGWPTIDNRVKNIYLDSGMQVTFKCIQ